MGPNVSHSDSAEFSQNSASLVVRLLVTEGDGMRGDS